MNQKLEKNKIRNFINFITLKSAKVKKFKNKIYRTLEQMLKHLTTLVVKTTNIHLKKRIFLSVPSVTEINCTVSC